MSTLTFESAGSYSRRAVARRSLKSAPVPVVKKVVPLADAVVRSEVAAKAARKTKVSFGALVVAVVALHGYAYYWLTIPGNKEALAKFSPITIELPPPPVEKPKPPEPPKVTKVIPQKQVVIPENVPVVNTPVDPVATSPNTVAVAVAPPPAPPAPPPAPEPVTEARGFAGYKNNPVPPYPPVAQRRGIEGTVLLRVHVLATGFPDDVKVAKSSGQPILDESAVKTVLGWTFEPATRSKKPIDGYVSVPIIFKL